MVDSPLPASVADFRRHYRATEISARYSGPLHLAFTSLTCLVIIVASLSRIHGLTWIEASLFPAVFLYINFSEYLGHRFPMHHRTPGMGILFHRHTEQHHRFFTHQAMAFDGRDDYKMVLFPPAMILFFGGGFALPMGLLIAHFYTENAACVFWATIFGYFLNYELLHFAYHCPEDSRVGRLPGLKRLRRLHETHHDPRLMTRYGFNITYPIADWVFGTLQPRKSD